MEIKNINTNSLKYVYNMEHKGLREIVEGQSVCQCERALSKDFYEVTIGVNEWMNEWMNEWKENLYSALKSLQMYA